MNAIVFFASVFLVSGPGQTTPDSRIQVSHPKEVSANFVTLLNDIHPDNRIGYRIHEYLPLVAGSAPESIEDTDIDLAERERWIQEFQNRPGVFRVRRPVEEDGWIPQDWEFYFAPAEDGVDILWVIETREFGLPLYYSAQQCFRMSGFTNADWRRKVAETQAFSEYDLWNKQEIEGLPLVNLSYYRVGDVWSPFPAKRMKTIARTPNGRVLEKIAGLSENEVQDLLDPQHPAEFIKDAASGLMTRTDLNRDWICGLFWEGTTHLSNHHPADCLHAIVNIGSIPPNSKRAVRGKIYWMPGDLEDLLKRWRKDFGESTD